MKLLRMITIASLLAGSSVAMAGFPFDVGKLGHMRAVLEMCSRTSPHAATTYLLQIKSLIGKADKATVDKASRTEEYQTEYQSTRAEFNSLTQEGVVHACEGYLTSTN